MVRILQNIIRSLNRDLKHGLAKSLLLLTSRREIFDHFEGPLKSVAIIAQEKLGDAILLTPLIKNLRQAVPDIQIHVMAMGRTYSFFENDPNIDRVYRVKENWITYVNEIRRKTFDVSFNTKDHSSFTFLFQTCLVKARYRVGIEHPRHRGFFNHAISCGFHEHMILKNCSLLDFLGISYSIEDCRPYLPEEKISKEVAQFLNDLPDCNLIGCNLSAGEKDREWPIHKWEKLVKNMTHPVIIFSMPERYREKEAIEKKFEHVIPSPATKTIYEAGQIIRCLSLLVTGDTSLVHVASSYHIPVVGLYRSDPVHLTRFSPFGEGNHQVVSPSYRVSDISVQKVWNMIDVMMK